MVEIRKPVLPRAPIIPPPAGPSRAELHAFLCPYEPDHCERSCLRTWGEAVALRSRASLLPSGEVRLLSGAAFNALQRRTNDAFVPPAYRVRLVEPFLAFRFYGYYGERVTRLYASFYTVVRTPGFGEFARNLLGLTGRNSANNLVAVSLDRDSTIVVGGISNRAPWADQILVEDGTMHVVDNLARYRLPG